MTTSRPAFEQSLDVLERNRLVAHAAHAALVVGPLMLAASVAGVFPPGVMGFHVTALGLVGWYATRSRNLRARRRPAAVRADGEGVWVDGTLVVPRANVADGFFQPRSGRDPNEASSLGSSVKLIPMSMIAGVERGEDRQIRLRLCDGSEELLYTIMYTSMRSKYRMGNDYAAQHRDAVLARISEAHAAFRARGPAADVSSLVGRGTRSREEWRAALAKLRAAEGGYREAVVRDDDLWRVVEDPSAPEDARGGAAMLLRRSLDDAGKARVRVAAEATASPKLRVALDAAAGEADEAFEVVLDELAGDEAEPRGRTRAS